MKQKRRMTAKKIARERRWWRNIFVVSLAGVFIALLFFGCIAFLVSVLIALFAYMVYDSFKPSKDYGETPWWYGGL
jgi:uncharacterized membrane protein YjjP (DUF1212 family)